MNHNRPLPLPAASPVRGDTLFSTVDIRRLLATLWRRRLLIGGMVVAALTGAWLILAQITPMYTAASQVMIEGRQTRIIDLKEVLGRLQPMAATVVSEVEVIRSRQTARRVADKLKLYDDPDFNPALAPDRPQRLVDAVRVTIGAFMNRLSGEGDEPSLPAAEVDRRMRRAVVSRVLAGVTVEPIRQSLVIRITYRHSDPVRAALIANAYAEAYLEGQLEAKFEAVRTASTWLHGRLDALRDSVVEAERAVEAYRASSGLVSSSGQLATQQKLTELNSRLVAAVSKRGEMEARVARVEALLRSGRGVEARDEVLSSPFIQRLKEQEATLSREVSDLSNRYGDRHPLLLKGQTELADIRRKIDQEIETQVLSVRNELAVLRNQEQSLRAEVRSLETAVLGQNQDTVRLRELEREAQANRELYETFLARFKEAGEQEQIQQADVRIIGVAEPPTGPSSPNRRNYLMLAALLGVAGGVALTFVLEHVDNTLRTRDQAEAALALPAIGMVPQVTPRRDEGPAENYLISNPTSGFAEAFRMLWFTVKHATEHGGGPIVAVITSSLPDEGKSMVSLSLARTAASMGMKTVLLDADIRRSSIAKKIGLPAGPSLVDVLNGSAGVDTVIVKDVLSDLDVIPGKSSEFTNSQIRGLIGQAEGIFGALKNSYELVIVDCPPILPVADVQVLAKLADVTLFCVRWDHTPRQTAASAIRQLQDSGANIAGVILTRVNMRRHAGYGYQDAGYYYSKYRKYYAE